MNQMQMPRLEKITLNIGIGAAGDTLEKAKTLLAKITGKNPVLTEAKTRQPTWKVRKGDKIGAKITIRGKQASELLKKALDVVETTIPEKSFDKNGNVAFGIKEYIDFPGMKYDPEIGMMGFDVCATLSKPGARISRRKIIKKKLPQKQRVSPQEAIEFMKSKFNVKVTATKKKGEEEE